MLSVPLIGTVAPYVDNAFRQFYMETAEIGATTIWTPFLAFFFHVHAKAHLYLQPSSAQQLDTRKDQTRAAARFQDEL